MFNLGNKKDTLDKEGDIVSLLIVPCAQADVCCATGHCCERMGSWRIRNARRTTRDVFLFGNLTPQKARFRSVNNYKELQEIHIQVKSEYVGTLTMTEFMTQSGTISTITCLTWTQT